jgi:hypothetical protein
VGTSVKITGVSLTQTKEVTFGGVKATTFKVNSERAGERDRAQAQRPGKIAITTPEGGFSVVARVLLDALSY